MTYLALAVLLLSGCVFPSDFDGFTFKGSAIEADAGPSPGDAAQSADGGSDAAQGGGASDGATREPDAATQADGGGAERDAATPTDAGRSSDAGALCLDPSQFVCKPGWQGLPCDTCPGGIGCFGPCE